MEKTYLVDLDNTVFDVYNGFIKSWNSINPEREISLDNNQSHYYLEKNFEGISREEVSSTLAKRGFFENLPPLEGAVEAINKIKEKYGNVFFVTAPYLFGLTEKTYPHSPSEKYESIKKNFGKKWLDYVVLARDKTLIKGDFLIDDSPKINGSLNPGWQRIVYNQNYNKDLSGIRLDWKNWEEVICSL